MKLKQLITKNDKGIITENATDEKYIQSKFNSLLISKFIKKSEWVKRIKSKNNFNNEYEITFNKWQIIITIEE